MKQYNLEDLMDKFQKLTKQEKINALELAIGYMQQYNGRTQDTCIALGMGYKHVSNSIDLWTKNKQ